MIYGIGDLHFDYSKDKPMDIFGDNWIDHDKQIIKFWNENIENEDLILIPGDISWALKLEDAYYDLKRIDELPGTKVFVKGNHDYWWQSLNKINNLNLESLVFLQNSSYVFKDYAIAGTRGWSARDSEGFSDSDEKVFRREVLRLKMSLDSIPKNIEKKIVMLHYPPFNNKDQTPNEFVEVMKEYNVDICLYGHLHAGGHKYAVEGNIYGIDFHCISSDFINFEPKLIIKE